MCHDNTANQEHMRVYVSVYNLDDDIIELEINLFH